jgi:hypothetical protein
MSTRLLECRRVARVFVKLYIDAKGIVNEPDYQLFAMLIMIPQNREHSSSTNDSRLIASWTKRLVKDSSGISATALSLHAANILA